MQSKLPVHFWPQLASSAFLKISAGAAMSVEEEDRAAVEATRARKEGMRRVDSFMFNDKKRFVCKDSRCFWFMGKDANACFVNS
jgi:hypothetical protein